ncbi:DUF7931 domain-containing protein [Thiocapsa bogorovii]|uniref:DUF7931 domain-containing protein n=1 Tax=Thiocapsa bogorovii TaxID=521689 RepID=UPI001E4E636A|nr:hypothetical protein [Thiocapsa bogorovii]UHD14987.1 hypothetical protein LT988_17100 [Thiocapsa bogorovii]
MNRTHPPSDPRLLATRSEIRDAGVAIAQTARRELLVFDRTLDCDLYNAQTFVEAVKRLALARPDAPVRVLLSYPEQGVKNVNQVVELAQRLTSRIAIRRLVDDLPVRPDAFLIADERTYLKRPLAEGSEGIADMHGRVEARRLRNDFEQMWEHAEIHVELRRLHL